LILYDKSGMFLGMGTQELSLLGYEDIEEFRNYHNDVADLFINKPGYIFKFKNFSWIDYTLHSGTPNRRVLIKSKNGREIDSALHIHEIFLSQEIYGSKTCFGVEFVSANAFSKAQNSPMPSSAPELFAQTPEPQAPQEKTPFVMEDAPTFLPSQEEEPPPSKVSFESNTPLKEPEFSFESTSAPQSLGQETAPLPETGSFKLKFDSDILNEPSFDAKPIEPKNEVSFAQNVFPEVYPEDKHEDLLNDNLLSVQAPSLPSLDEKIENAPILFDFSLSAESLGLDISTLAEIITDYVEELDTKMPLLGKALESEQHAYAKEEIAKLKSVAYHLHIAPLCTQFEQLENHLDAGTVESRAQAFLGVQNVISKLKDSIQC